MCRERTVVKCDSTHAHSFVPLRPEERASSVCYSGTASIADPSTSLPTRCAPICVKGIKGSCNTTERCAKTMGEGDRDGAKASIARSTSRPTRVVESVSSEKILRRSRTRRRPAEIMRQRVNVMASMFSGRWPNSRLVGYGKIVQIRCRVDSRLHRMP